MDEQSHSQDDVSAQTVDDQKERRPQRPYVKPRIEPHGVSKSILGNASPVTPDGLSDTFRL
jgi:hypothetical protein